MKRTMKSWLIAVSTRCLPLGVMLAVAVPAAAQSASPAPAAPAPYKEPYMPTQDRAAGGGYDFRPDRDTPDTIRRFEVLQTFSRCAASISSNVIAKGLLVQPLSPAERPLFDIQYQLGGCPQSGAVTRIDAFIRGGYAEAIFLKRVKDPLPALTPESPQLAKFLDQETAFSSLRPKQDSVMAISMACMAAIQPGIAQKILESRHGTPQEATLMDLLFREASNCAGEKRPAGLSRAFIRVYLAEEVYRYALFIQHNDASKG